MNTIIERFDSIDLIRPVGDFMWPHHQFEGFPTCCGAGKAGDKFIPDSVWGVNISPACWVHDQMWSMAPATWGAFHYSNSVLLLNCAFIIQARSANVVSCKIRLASAANYWLGVTIAGSPIFWAMKAQGAVRK
jgi:hypothetical protein